MDQFHPDHERALRTALAVLHWLGTHDTENRTDRLAAVSDIIYRAMATRRRSTAPGMCPTCGREVQLIRLRGVAFRTCGCGVGRD